MKKIVSTCLLLLVITSMHAGNPGFSPVEDTAIVNGEKGRAIDSLLSGLYKREKFFGNVLIAEKGIIIYRNSFGKSNIAENKDLDAESLFELASVSKQFTAMGIMLLKKEGKLNYDDSLRKFIPELPYYNITIRQLLNHTSGLPDYMDLVMEHWDTSKVATNKDMINLLATYHPKILFTPGEKWQYSNTGYAILSSIIERVSKKSFGGYLEQMIFRPLGMNRTRVYQRRYEKTKIPNYAYGYTYSKSQKKFILPDDDPELASFVYCLDGISGDGGVNSTVNDLFKWDRALYTNKLVSKEMLDEAFSQGTLNDGKKTNYGFGWAIGYLAGAGRIYNHSGGWPGYNTFIERHPEKDKTIIILRNFETSTDVTSQIRNILYGEKSAAKADTKKEIKLTDEVLQQYAGEYELTPDFSITITVKDGKIYEQATGQSKAEIFAEKEDLFFLKVVEAQIKFTRDSTGRVEGMVLLQNGNEVPGSKKK